MRLSGKIIPEGLLEMNDKVVGVGILAALGAGLIIFGKAGYKYPLNAETFMAQRAITRKKLDMTPLEEGFLQDPSIRKAYDEVIGLDYNEIMRANDGVNEKVVEEAKKAQLEVRLISQAIQYHYGSRYGQTYVNMLGQITQQIGQYIRTAYDTKAMQKARYDALIAVQKAYMKVWKKDKMDEQKYYMSSGGKTGSTTLENALKTVYDLVDKQRKYLNDKTGVLFQTQGLGESTLKSWCRPFGPSTTGGYSGMRDKETVLNQIKHNAMNLISYQPTNLLRNESGHRHGVGRYIQLTIPQFTNVKPDVFKKAMLAIPISVSSSAANYNLFFKANPQVKYIGITRQGYNEKEYYFDEITTKQNTQWGEVWDTSLNWPTAQEMKAQMLKTLRKCLKIHKANVASVEGMHKREEIAQDKTDKSAQKAGEKALQKYVDDTGNAADMRVLVIVAATGIVGNPYDLHNAGFTAIPFKYTIFNPDGTKYRQEAYIQYNNTASYGENLKIPLSLWNAVVEKAQSAIEQKEVESLRQIERAATQIQHIMTEKDAIIGSMREALSKKIYTQRP